MITASALPRVAVCPGSAVLPRVRETTAGAALGTIRHRYLERVPAVGREAALAEVEDEDTRALLAAIDLEGLPLDPSCYAQEVAFAWSWETGQARELGRGNGRDYSALEPHEMAGTADVVALNEDGVFVADWKSEHDRDVAPPARNLQLRWLAMAAARTYGRSSAVVEIIRPREDGAWRERGQLDAFDLDLVADETRRLIARVEASRADVPTLVVGAHCRRCPCLRYCPAQTALVRELGHDGLAERIGRELTPASAGAVWARVKAARAALDKIDQAIEALAHQTPIPLPDGRWLRPEQRRYESYDAHVLWTVLRERYGEDAAWAAVEMKAVKARLKDVLRAHAGAGAKLATLERAVTDDVAARGGLHVAVRDEVRVGRPPKEDRR